MPLLLLTVTSLEWKITKYLDCRYECGEVLPASALVMVSRGYLFLRCESLPRHLIAARCRGVKGNSGEGNKANKPHRKGQLPELHILRCGSAPLLHIQQLS